MTKKENGKSRNWWESGHKGPEFVELCPTCEYRLRKKALYKLYVEYGLSKAPSDAYMEIVVPRKDTIPLLMQTIQSDEVDAQYGQAFILNR